MRAEPRIALCPSGGGFRAALFHLGVLRRLHETGVLDQISTISSVSGGSIVAAFVADRIVALGGQEILENHGYTLAEAGMRRYLPDLLSPEETAFTLPHPNMLDTGEAAAGIANSHRRFSLKRASRLR